MYSAVYRHYCEILSTPYKPSRTPRAIPRDVLQNIPFLPNRRLDMMSRGRKKRFGCHVTFYKTSTLNQGGRKILDGLYGCKYNVTGTKCHSRRFVGWMDIVVHNVPWSVRGERDGLGTDKHMFTGTSSLKCTFNTKTTQGSLEERHYVVLKNRMLLEELAPGEFNQ